MISISERAVIDKSAYIECDNIEVGDYAYIGPGVRIIMPEFKLGDYSKLHAYSYCYGQKPLHIGSCCWIGGGCVLDSIGGLYIGNGFLAGASNHIWSHVKGGDVLLGSRFLSQAPVMIGNDVWLMGGHNSLCSVDAKDRSMCLCHSVITREMQEDRTYAGSPARDITAKVGPQYGPMTDAEKWAVFTRLKRNFLEKHPELEGQLEASAFNPVRRTYRKTHSVAEVAFMREHVPNARFYAA